MRLQRKHCSLSYARRALCTRIAASIPQMRAFCGVVRAPSHCSIGNGGTSGQHLVTTSDHRVLRLVICSMQPIHSGFTLRRAGCRGSAEAEQRWRRHLSQGGVTKQLAQRVAFCCQVAKESLGRPLTAPEPSVATSGRSCDSPSCYFGNADGQIGDRGLTIP